MCNLDTIGKGLHGLQSDPFDTQKNFLFFPLKGDKTIAMAVMENCIAKKDISFSFCARQFVDLLVFRLFCKHHIYCYPLKSQVEFERDVKIPQLIHLQEALGKKIGKYRGA